MRRSISLFSLIPALLCMGIIGGCAGTPQSEKNKLIVQRFIDEMWSAGNLAVAEELIVPDYVQHSQAGPAVEVTGIEGLKKYIEENRATFPDYQETIEIIFAEGDYVAHLDIITGTQEGEMGSFPPSGKQMTLHAICIERLEEGKIAETWAAWDNITVLTQLGFLSPPQESKE